MSNSGSNLAKLFLEKFYQAIDSREPARFSEFFAEDGEFIFGNYPASRGRAEIEAAAQGVFTAVDDIRHELKTYSADPSGRLLMEGQVYYRKKNGVVIQVPFACGMTLDSQLKEVNGSLAPARVRHYQAYVDLAPLWSG